MVNNGVHERQELDSSFELITACCRLGSCEGTFSVVEPSSHPWDEQQQPKNPDPKPVNLQTYIFENPAPCPSLLCAVSI